MTKRQEAIRVVMLAIEAWLPPHEWESATRETLIDLGVSGDEIDAVVRDREAKGREWAASTMRKEGLV